MTFPKSLMGMFKFIGLILLTAPCSICGMSDQVSAAEPLGAAASSPGHWRLTPLLDAVGRNDINEVRRLLDGGARPDDPAAGRSPLIQAITLRFDADNHLHCSLPIVNLLLDHGADANRPDSTIGTLPLLAAFSDGDIDCADALRTAGARVNARDAGGHTILTSAVGAAARLGDMHVLDVAIQWGIDKNYRADDGYTALHEAVRIQSVRVVAALLERGTNPCIKNAIGQTPLAMAINLKRAPAMVDVLSSATHCSDRPT